MKIMRELTENYKINNPDDVYKYLNEFIDEDREYIIVIGLDSKNIPCYREIVHIGTLNATIMHPREVFKKAIIMSCNKIIVAHNHPSGDTTPSDEDITIIKRLVTAGKLLSIEILDAIIIGNTYNSIIDEI